MSDIFKKDFETYSNKKYKDFNNNLARTNKYIYGLTIPKQRELAIQYFKENDISILDKIDCESIEETNIYLLLITKFYKNEECLKMIYNNAYKMDSWVNTDLCATCLKFIKKDPNRYYDFILKMLNDECLWNSRLALVIFLSYYLKCDYLDEIIDKSLNIKRNEYYFEMALAWFLSYVAIVNEELFLKYINDERLSQFTRKMSIRKSIESFRVKDSFKDTLKKMIK